MKKVLVTGGSGQVGREIKAIKPDWVYVSSVDYNLTKCDEVHAMLKTHKPTHIIHLAAKVGGIIDNINLPSDYLSQNILMNTLLVEFANRYNIKHFIGILSTCIYPDKVSKYPMSEDALHDGPPAPTNFSYGIAKRAMAVHIDAMNKQYGTNYCYLTPCNLYGVYDKFDDRSHFVAALIEKIANAKKNNLDSITLFGTGKPLRQFMNAKDFAKIIIKMIEEDIYSNFNVATKENISIHDIAKIALNALDCNHIKIKYDTTKPDGQYRKDVDISKFKEHFPEFQFIDLKSGIRDVYNKVFLEK